jgi:dolichol-phosphate mannosyltransferase
MAKVEVINESKVLNLIKRLFKIRIVNFMFVGGLGFLVNMAVYYPVTYWLQTQTTILGQQFYLPATLISLPCSISFNYWMNKKWTFKDKKSSSLSYGQYLVMGLATSVLDVVLLFLLVHFGHLFYMVAFILATIVMFLSRYFISNFWIWKRSVN